MCEEDRSSTTRKSDQENSRGEMQILNDLVVVSKPTTKMSPKSQMAKS